MEKFFLRLGFLTIFFLFVIGLATYKLLGFDIFEYLKENIELNEVIDNMLFFVLFISILSAYYFMYKCIRHFWSNNYNKFFKIIIIIISIGLFFIPMLVYYIKYMELGNSKFKVLGTLYLIN